MQKLLSFILGGAIFGALCAVPVKAQYDTDYVPIVKASKNKSAATTTRRKPKAARKQTVNEKTRVVTTTKVVKTTGLIVTTEPDAEVSLTPLTGTAAPKPQNADKKGVANFENLKAVKYKILITLDGYEPLEQESVEVLAQKTLGINLDLTPVTYDLNIDTNVADGEIRFAPAELVRRNNRDELEETGDYCFVKIQNGKAVIKELKKGIYKLDIRATALEYDTRKVSVKVPEDILDKDEESGKVEAYSLELEKKFSTEQFLSAWTNNEWSLPSGWGLQNSKMTTNGAVGVALPRSEQFRYYVDFEMRSSVKMLDDNKVGFVFRAQDAQNYYLVELSGARAAEPYRAAGYVVKNGVRGSPIFTQPIENVAKSINKQFSFIIKGNGNRFDFFIEDSATGESLPLGNMPDPFNNFKKGAVGIAGSASSKFEVVFFTVICKGNCR